MNYSPYEIKILLEVHSGMTITAPRGVPLFAETMTNLMHHGLVRASGYSYAPGENLPALIAHVLDAPRPIPPGQRPRLTAKQMAIFMFLMEYAKAIGMPPTRREIADRFGFKSANAAQEHLESLERKGYVTISAGQRGLRMHP